MSAGSDSTFTVQATNLEQQRKLAKDLLKAARSKDARALSRIGTHRPDVKQPKLSDAQLAIAREAGFESWPKLVKALEQAELKEAAIALHEGDAKKLRRILSSSPSVRRHINDPIGPFGSRPVQMAAQFRDVLDVLIDHGADVNLRSDWSGGPFGV